MAQYPFAVVFTTETDLFRYVVTANDRVQAQARARKKHYAAQGEDAPGDVGRTLNLDPKRVDGKFLPRIDGTVMSQVPRDTKAEAVDAALEFLNTRRSNA
jgi:hypothetical protein